MKVRKNLKDVVRYTSAQDPDLTKIRLNSAERNIPLPAKLYNDWLNRLKETYNLFRILLQLYLHQKFCYRHYT